MPIARRSAPLLLVFLLLWQPPAASSPPVPDNTLVLLVRHAERESTERDSALSAAGRTRALALREVLRDAGVEAIVVTQYRRTWQTAQPLAELLALEPEAIETTGGAAVHAAAVADAIRSRHRGRVVLVVGHSNTVPAIVAALGGPALPDLCDTAHSNLFVVQLHADGRTHLVRTRYGADDPLPAEECTA